jgi:hypothetical protein
MHLDLAEPCARLGHRWLAAELAAIRELRFVGVIETAIAFNAVSRPIFECAKLGLPIVSTMTAGVVPRHGGHTVRLVRRVGWRAGG